jgi:IS5 family transposase
MGNVSRTPARAAESEEDIRRRIAKKPAVCQEIEKLSGKRGLPIDRRRLCVPRFFQANPQTEIMKKSVMPIFRRASSARRRRYLPTELSDHTPSQNAPKTCTDKPREHRYRADIASASPAGNV